MTTTETVTLTLLGPVPSKKNRWKHGMVHTYLPAEVTAQILGLTLQAKSQWRHREPAIHPDISIQFYVLSRRQDRDNMATAIYDILRDAGVVVDDNIAKCNGKLTIMPAVMVKTYQRVVIEVTYSK
jgi:Holliday junction resolvase RusA-like endonuclease